MCRPSCQEAYGLMPELGQRMSDFAEVYPTSLVDRMASGSVSAKRGSPGSISQSARQRTLTLFGLEAASDRISVLSNADPYPLRKWFEDPDWVGELCDSLHFKECFRYKFKRSGHINGNGSRTYKSWIKCLAKTEPNSRVV